MKIILCDYNGDLSPAWKFEFESKPLPDWFEVEIRQGNILDGNYDAIVSPANSFGFMDGGIDLAYTEFFGRNLQKILQDNIRSRPIQELLVGDAVVLKTNNSQIPYLISAPTMRTPQDLNGTINVYLASKAALASAIDSHLVCVAFPGMGTGVGALSPKVAAVQMHRGFVDAIVGMKPTSSVFEIALDERNLIVGNDTKALHLTQVVESN